MTSARGQFFISKPGDAIAVGGGGGGGAIALQGFEVGAIVAARVGGIEGATHSAEVCSID